MRECRLIGIGARALDSTSHRRLPTRVALLSEQIRELALLLEPGEKLPTVRELCERYQSSPITISDALDYLEAQHVLYRRQGSGIYVSPNIHRKCFCILFDSDLLLNAVTSPFWGILWALIAQEAQVRSAQRNEYFSFHLLIRREQEAMALSEEVIALVEEERVHGMLAIGLNTATICWLQDRHIPCIAFAGPGQYPVWMDYQTMARQAVGLLVERGCRRLAFWGKSTWREDRYVQPIDHETAGWKQALEAYGMPFDPTLVRDNNLTPLREQSVQPIHDQDQGYRIAREVFGSGQAKRPDGIFICDDMLTDGAMTAFAELGVQIGQQVHIVSHANTGSPMLYPHRQHLLCLEFDPADLVKALFSSLDALLAGELSQETLLRIEPRLQNRYL